MHRLTAAAVAAMLALPASAIAAPTRGAAPARAAAHTRGVVLSVNAGHRTIEVVNGRHLVHSYRYRGSLPKLHRGSRISFARNGHTIAGVRVARGKSGSVTFYGRVVRSSATGLVLRLGDGATASFSSKQISAVLERVKTHWIRWRSVRPGALHTGTAGGPLHTATAGGGLTLPPGTLVLVTERSAGGHTTITVTLPAGSPASRGGASQSTGTGQAGGLPTDNGDDTSADVVGTITQLSQTALTITVGGRFMTFACDPADDLTDGFAAGDLVDVTYDTSSGSPVASDVEYVESDAAGAVTAVDTANLTLTNSDTGQTETIVADPAEEMFDGVSVNDEVVITYHQSAGQLIADVVDDETAGN